MWPDLRLVVHCCLLRYPRSPLGGIYVGLHRFIVSTLFIELWKKKTILSKTSDMISSIFSIGYPTLANKATPPPPRQSLLSQVPGIIYVGSFVFVRRNVLPASAYVVTKVVSCLNQRTQPRSTTDMVIALFTGTIADAVGAQVLILLL